MVTIPFIFPHRAMCGISLPLSLHHTLLLSFSHLFVSFSHLLFVTISTCYEHPTSPASEEILKIIDQTHASGISLQQASRSAWTCWAKGPISMLQIFMTMNHLAGFAQPLNLVSSFLPLRHHLRKCSNPKYNLPIPSQILHDLRNYFSALFFAYVSSICSSCVSRKVLHLCHYYIRMLG